MVERQPNTVYVASLSYGKDSIAMLEAIKQLGMPLDRIIHAEVWATDDISADLPPMVEFKKKADEIILDRYGIVVEHTCAMRKRERERERTQKTEIVTHKGCHTSLGSTTFQKESTETKYADSQRMSEAGAKNSNTKMDGLEKVTYEKLFYHIPKRKKQSTRGGAVLGFPQVKGNWCNGLKRQPIHAVNNYRIPVSHELVQWKSQSASPVPSIQQSKGQSKDFHSETRKYNGATTSREAQTVFSDKPVNDGQKINIVQYLGIAADEPERIKRHTKDGITLPLVEIGWDEAYCRKWCEENDLLSPIYTSATRGGCWFCHNQGVNQLRLLRRNYPDLWALLMKWDLDSPVTFKSDGHTVHDFDKRFQLEDEGLIDSTERFRWKYIEDGEPLQIRMEGFC